MASGEDELIARYFRPLTADPGAFGLFDDAAVLKGSTDDLVVTVDAIVEGVHFLSGDPPDTVARKALRVNISDLTAKGATPAGFVLTLALREASETWLTPFARGLGEDASAFACPLLGGDTVSTPGPLTISITAFGRVPAGRMVRRSGAGEGDAVVVSGTIGDATLGLALLNGRLKIADAAAAKILVERYRVPQPPTALAVVVREHASAAMDVSDGLAGDLAKLCKASEVSAEIRLEQVPVSPEVATQLAGNATTIEALISGGDDYQVLCSVPQGRLAAFTAAARTAAVTTTVIGMIRAGAAAPGYIAPDGRRLALERGSYSHF